MSTYLHLRCDAHTPPLYSEDVGQHLYDLPDIRRYIADREVLVGAVVHYDMTSATHFISNAVRFLTGHPTCPLSIEDEYGKEHPIEEQS